MRRAGYLAERQFFYKGDDVPCHHIRVANDVAVAVPDKGGGPARWGRRVLISASLFSCSARWNRTGWTPLLPDQGQKCRSRGTGAASTAAYPQTESSLSGYTGCAAQWRSAPS